ncbi:DUF2292 domain-containing protein [Alicyclobacillus sp. SO9]|uniref:DUF2292 domain-containing protein n=1 Tax=Alicyclobacillus sp. SO9 TaxID=2665646 RepID=UPI0018E79CA7|nr:DUF2292 domain-containing protein [Alicyclobacillus sp. SO9]QQE80919.1 DUF2292 domain-containing protein [Alicyclobacillus sp. SO9]
MTHVNRLDAPRRDPTASSAIGHADRHKKNSTVRVIVKRGDKVLTESELPPFGEVNITMHSGKVTFIERVKEKVE